MQFFAFDNIRLASAIHGLFAGLVLLIITLFGIAFFSFQDSTHQNNYLMIEASNTKLIGDISLNAQKISAHNLEAYQKLQNNSQKLVNQLNILKKGGYWGENQNILPDEAHATLLSHMLRLTKEIQQEGTSLYQLSFRADSVGNQYLKSDINYDKQTFFLQKIAENTVNLRASNQRLEQAYIQTVTLSNQYKQFGIILFFVVNFIILIFIYRWILNQLMLSVHKTLQASKKLMSGNLNIESYKPSNDEIGDITRNINQLTFQLSKATDFATQVGEGKFDTPFTPVSEDDRLGKALLEMRDNLKSADNARLIRRRINEGIALFNDLLKKTSDNEEEFAYQMISALVKFLDANQGGFYVIEKENEVQTLSLVASYAYNKRKYINQKVLAETGILGQAVQEKQTILTKNIPENYVYITSGLGEATPSNMVTVPLIHNEQVFGVLEIASFKLFESHEVGFVEQISENIASVLATVRNNQRMKNLLSEAEMYSEQVTAQEEELRMGLEEFTATQEENKRIIHQTEEKLHLLEQVQEITEDLVFGINQKYCLTFINQTLYEAYKQGGIEPKIGMYAPNLFPENEQIIQIERYQKAFKGEKLSVFHHLETPDGKIHFETKYQKIDENQVLVISRNITHIKNS